MTIDVYWGSGSPTSWRVLLALEHKELAYNSHLLQLAMQEHKAPHMLALNPRGRVSRSRFSITSNESIPRSRCSVVRPKRAR